LRTPLLLLQNLPFDAPEAHLCSFGNLCEAQAETARVPGYISSSKADLSYN
jgi:hypothetical protein